MEDEGRNKKLNTTGNSFEKALRKLMKRKPFSSIRNWGISYSLWPVHFTTACCGAEFAAAFAPRYDAERFGALPFVGTRQCNVIFIEGTLTKKMAEAAKIVYQQMPEPKFVIGMGACAIDGGIFWNSYNIVRSHDILPVEAFIIGCPPRPEGVLRGIIMTQRKIQQRGTPYPES
jgi:NADH-quinone oxidoreductase subunit B